MAHRSLPIDHELVVYVGTDTLREYRWLPDGATPQDFTGWSARIHIAPVRGACELHLTTDNSEVTLSSDGLISFRLSAAQSRALITPSPIYALDLKDPDEVITRFVRGRVTLVRDIGREGVPP